MYPFGIHDEEFIRGHVPMTKAEIRAMVMVKAGIRPDDVIADIGAGTGSLSIEAALHAPQGKVYAIERNPQGIELIGKNAEKFGCSNIEIIQGTAPEALEELPPCDVVLIGGSGGNLHGILDVCGRLLKKGGRLVMTAVTIETAGEVMKEFEERPFRLEGFQMQINRLNQMGRYHLFVPMSPVFIFTASEKEEE